MDVTYLLGGTYLNAEGLKTELARQKRRSLVLTIEAFDVRRMRSRDGEEAEKGVLKLNGADRELEVVVNKSNLRRLKEGFGPESEGWLGKPVRLSVAATPVGPGIVIEPPSSIDLKSQAQKVTVPNPASKQETMPKATERTKISLEEFGGGIKVMITGNGSITPKIFSLDKNRIVMDFPKTVINAPLPSKVVLPLKEIRSGKHKDKSRLVLELNEKMPFDVLSSGDTVVITVLKSDNKPSPPPVEQKAPEITEAKEIKERDISDISTRLLKNAHPMSNSKEKQTEVSLLEGKREAHSGDTLVVRKRFLF